jgi:hypothetical protein
MLIWGGQLILTLIFFGSGFPAYFVPPSIRQPLVSGNSNLAIVF